MASVRPTEDIQPLTAFRANVAGFVDQVRATGRPLVLTQHGRGAAVLLSAADYEALVDELELLREVALAEREIEAGQGIPHEEVERRLAARLKDRLDGVRFHCQ
ncbi:MAG TPA: type II toxin-antitoxin system Phd/YefM family antitoxin [Longimicrobiales bacterium]|nr:type II toxin-antitoxin system Phd/YefM family antitoxin [Longimicrobiales bacterium]